MAKIVRKTQKQFASNAINNGQFGSAQLGTKVVNSDVDVLQALPAFENGWNDATISSEKLPTLEEMQGLHYITTRQIAYIMQEGVAEYDVGTAYFMECVVKKPGTYELYGSIIDDNIGNALPSQVDNANWQYLGDLAALKDAGTAIVPDASTTVKGIIELATAAEVKSETAGVLAITPDTLRSSYGIPDGQVIFNGVGTVTILVSKGIITSVSRLSTGIFRVNFTPLSGLNFGVVLGVRQYLGATIFYEEQFKRTLSSIDVNINNVNAGGGPTDSDHIYVEIIDLN